MRSQAGTEVLGDEAVEAEMSGSYPGRHCMCLGPGGSSNGMLLPVTEERNGGHGSAACDGSTVADDYIHSSGRLEL